MTPIDFLRDPAVFVPTCIVLGLCVGSFLNVVIHRLPTIMERRWRAECAELSGTESPAAEKFNLVVPRSRCPSCGHGITALENIPLISYFALGGKCSACKTQIPSRYPLVEALTGLLSGYAAWRFGFSTAAFGALLFSWAMVALAFIDLDTSYLPDNITLPLLWAGLLFNLFGIFTDLKSAVIGAAGGYLALWSVFWSYRLATGKDGMGYGDFKLLGAIGAWLGWKMLPLAILLSSVAGAAIGIALIAFARHGRDTPIPFGPYLAVAGLMALFHGAAITQRYLDLF
ncbi:MAG: methyltransferase [Betaproteobacteria bacterium RIFCSPLOWO2_12_FULL_62_58]|nr:MAG: methyltransferase [Betaproteobacteria bacterium RIFCSPLOWO2_12_FULL_62_58]